MTTFPYRIAFFGTSAFSVGVLEALFEKGIVPALIVTAPDKPQGRHLVVQPNEVKTWALEKHIPLFETAKLDDAAFETLAEIAEPAWDVFIVASYGKIIPRRFIEMPKRQTLNVHPSLLPKLRGAAPIQSAILEDIKDTGVSIMAIDEEMDHGPIVAQETVHIAEWPPYAELEKKLASVGGSLLASILPDWINGSLKPVEQDHTSATYTKKIEKADGLVDPASDPYTTFRKIQAYSEWPGTYFYTKRKEKNVRVIIKKAAWKDGNLEIERVIPEGKKEMSYADFLRAA